MTPLSVHSPSGTPKGGIVVVQEAFGVTDHIEDIGRRLAAEGWLAVIPHLFHRTGDPVLSYDDIASVFPHMKELTPEGVFEDVDAALARLDMPFSQVGIVGFCMGGAVALITAASRDVGAAVTFYGGGVAEGRFGFPSLVELAPSLRAPWLGLYGDLDQGIPVDQVEDLRGAVASSGMEFELVRYADAGHGFNCDVRGTFHEPSARDAWARTLAWFDRFLVS